MSGDLTGAFDPDGSGIFQAFIDRGGTITSYSVPGAAGTLAYEINNNKKLTVGYYIDASGVLHGQYRDANGALHFPIDPTGSVATVLFGVNNKNAVVGRYADSAGVTHGLFFVPPSTFHHLRLSRINFYIAKRNQLAGKYLWSLRRCFRHCPRIHSSRHRHTVGKSGGHAGRST